ncbi:MAG: adenylyl-sulfate reductase [Pelagibacteraceae bacterium]|nr:adenylyl-sulfate reductase [Pelagibacteraceae bacterium]PPR47295.1 MAG: hypothetical protein CFH19_00544 [Alphaproteobacteria bacterium MarineAlpha5_Bin9]|tara:strand:- start:1339 stop:2130 length:792 start_codon:yes stop_codon:yes gene_type:complete
MITTNPFFEISTFASPIFMKSFVVLMILLVIVGTILDMLHKKNVKYFFENSKKAKKSAIRNPGSLEKTSIIVKTVSKDILTTSELGGKRRIAHLLGMYGTLIFWTTSIIMIFFYTSSNITTNPVFPILWHLGAFMTFLGGSWFWFFLRVDVFAEAYPWYRIVKADLFVLSLVKTSVLALIWSFFQSINFYLFNIIFFILFSISNLILFGGVYWSKFAHMFYKPGAAIQKNLAEADGSRDNLPMPADKPKKFGLGIKREAPKHY